MSKVFDPAFPVFATVPAHPTESTPTTYYSPGMQLRDYFAAAALIPIMAEGFRTGRYDLQAMNDGITGAAIPSRVAYVVADAMMAEREKP